MTANRYFISEYSHDYFFHGGIGIIDAEKILERNGFIPIRQPFHETFTVRAKCVRFCYSLKMLLLIRRDATVVFIHPLHARLNKWLTRRLAKKVTKCICIVGDIDGLKDGDEILLKKEIALFSSFKYFVLHNPAMARWLNEVLPGKTVELIEFFDFLAEPATQMRTNHGPIVFAGNLSKSAFLEELGTIPNAFNLYGPGVSEKMLMQSNVKYLGVIDPYQLPIQLQGSYGLVWDGNSAFGMEGSLGNYMKYVSHHKLSLYILAGLPIIISQTAGAARLVEQYQVGFCVKSLEEVKMKINSITAGQYQQMMDNMKSLAKKIANGCCLSTALDRLEKKMD